MKKVIILNILLLSFFQLFANYKIDTVFILGDKNQDDEGFYNLSEKYFNEMTLFFDSSSVIAFKNNFTINDNNIYPEIKYLELTPHFLRNKSLNINQFPNVEILLVGSMCFFPENLEKLTKLKAITFGDMYNGDAFLEGKNCYNGSNYINFPQSILNCKYLQLISIARNSKFQYIPESVYNLPNLKTVLLNDLKSELYDINPYIFPLSIITNSKFNESYQNNINYFKKNNKSTYQISIPSDIPTISLSAPYNYNKSDFYLYPILHEKPDTIFYVYKKNNLKYNIFYLTKDTSNRQFYDRMFLSPHPKNILQIEGKKRKGKLNGKWLIKFRSGKIAEERNYLMGIEDGNWIGFYENGDTAYTVHFQKGYLSQFQFYIIKGNDEYDSTFYNLVAKIVTSPIVSMITKDYRVYSKYILDNHSITYYINEEFLGIKDLVDNKTDGTIFEIENNMLVKKIYTNNVPNGKWEYWSIKNYLKIKDEIYQKGKLTNTTQY